MQDSIKTVLVVEDEDGVRNLLRTLLRLAGVDALTCRDGAEALDLLAARGGDIHLLITDIHLDPDMDGVELAGELRARLPHLKVLYISGAEAEDRVEREVSAGLAEFLLKPFTPTTFTAATQALLSQLSAVAAS